MTDPEIAARSGAFSAYLNRYRDCFLQGRTADHFDHSCRGPLAALPRKSVEPIALTAGTAVRTLQEFLVTAHCNHLQARDRFPRHLAPRLSDLPSDRLGTVGVFDETSAVKKGNQTPGVQRQYRGCVGKIDNGIVTVHVGLACGRFQALLDAELFVPGSWDQDRERCQQAGIANTMPYRAKWRLAFDPLLRLEAHGIRFDWLTFDEG